MGAQGNLAQYLASAGPTVANFGANLQGLGFEFSDRRPQPGVADDQPHTRPLGVPSPMTLTPGSFQTNVTTGAGGQPIPQTQSSAPAKGSRLMSRRPGRSR
jgi:hypothetical protein